MDFSTLKRSLAIGLCALGITVSQVAMRPGPPGTVRAEQVALPILYANTPEEGEAAVPESNPYLDPSQCVYLAWELAEQAGHRLPNWGDAAEWRQGAIGSGYRVSDTLSPDAVNSIAVWGPGVGGTSYAGHVGWVLEVDGNRFLVRDRNWDGYDSRRWVDWEPGISFIILGARPEDLRVVEPLTLSTASAQVGETVRARFKLRNEGDRPVTLQALVAAGRRGGAEGDSIADFAHVSNVTLRPGEEYVYDQESSFAEVGHYSARPAVKMNGGWAEIPGSNRAEFDVHELRPDDDTRLLTPDGGRRGWARATKAGSRLVTLQSVALRRSAVMALPADGK